MPNQRATAKIIVRLAAENGSVVHARSLRAEGIGRHAVALRVAAGWMAPILPATYAVGPMCDQPTREMRCIAGVLSGGPSTVIDHETAAVLLDVWDRADDVVHVTVPGRAMNAPPAPFRFHRAPAGWSTRDGRSCGLIPLAGFVDMCERLARSLTKWQLAFVIGRGVHERFVTLHELEARLETLRRVPWVTVLRGAVELVRSGSAGTRGRSEDELLRLLLAADAPEPIVNTRGAMGMSRDEPDLYWPAQRVNVEVDGGHHDEPGQAADDAVRDIEAAGLGCRVVRIPWRLVWRRPTAVVRVVQGALAGKSIEFVGDSRRIWLPT